jgi:FHS family L-fucose permease-like MFS transporter
MAGVAAMLTTVVVVGGGPVGVYSLVAISGCMSLMFPMIFGLAVDGLGEDRKIGGAGLIMAILGGATLTPMQGLISDMTGSISVAFLVPLGCFAVVGAYSLSFLFLDRMTAPSMRRG